MRLTRLRGRPVRHRPTRDEGGSSTLELCILGPGLLLFITVVIYAGRIELAGQAVQQAADEAARSASIQRTRVGANAVADAEARNSLDQQGLDCRNLTVVIDTKDFTNAPGENGRVFTTVTCRVELSDLILPGIPGAQNVTARGISPIDTYRERS